jgi:hypothetical protein
MSKRPAKASQSPLEPEPTTVKQVPVGAPDADFRITIAPDFSADGQGWLFPEVIRAPEVGERYRKAVAAIHAVPVTGEGYKLALRKVMEALARIVQGDFRSLQQRSSADADEFLRKLRQDRVLKLYEVRVADIARLANTHIDNPGRITEIVETLVGFKMTWNVIGEDKEVEFAVTVPYLVRAERGVGRRNGVVRFGFDPDLLLMILEPFMWANLSWTVLSQIGHGDGKGQTAAYGLYQNIWRYINTHQKITPSWEVGQWALLLLGPCRFVSEAPDGERVFSNYKEFKRDYLKPALEILNSNSSLNHTVELVEEKSGRKVTHLRFRMHEKTQEAMDFSPGWPEATLARLRAMRMSAKDIANLSQNYTLEMVDEALKRLAASNARIGAQKNYFLGILSNVAQGIQLTKEADEKIRRAAERVYEEEAAARQKEQAQARFSAHQHDLFKRWVHELAPEARAQLIQAHLAARPQDQLLYREQLTAPYLAVLSQWVKEALPDTYLEICPMPRDRDFQAWLLWQTGVLPESDSEK